MRTLRCITALLFVTIASAATAADKTLLAIYDEQSYSCEGKPDGRLFAQGEPYGYGLWQIRADLNFDGREDLLLRDTIREGACGNGGCPIRIYMQQQDGLYRAYEDNSGAHPKALFLKQQAKNTGDLITYWHLSARSGSIDHRLVRESGITVEPSEVFEASESDDEAEKEYNQKFSDAKKLTPEYAICKNGILGWSPSYD